jgi:hypothetical protein
LRWFDYYSLYQDDPFGTKRDQEQEGSEFYEPTEQKDPESPEYFTDYQLIPDSETARLDLLFPSGIPPDALGSTIKGRLSRLGSSETTESLTKLESAAISH